MMKTLIAIIPLLFGAAFAQEGESMIVRNEWPQNDHTLAGAIVDFVFEGLENGSCLVELPEIVNMLHVMNGHVVSNSDDSNAAEGRYKISAPAHWEAINGTFNVLIMFDRDTIFNLTDIVFTCDPSDTDDLSVYSFPQNNLVKEASSNVHYRPGFHRGEILTVILPFPVARFNFTTMDSRYTVTSEDMTTFSLSGFQNEKGNDHMKEVHFSLDYEDSAGDGSGWFSAAQVTVAVSKEDPDAP